jgi:purine nucleosidase/pyrimidine-specific ribonucleoside hydrolase
MERIPIVLDTDIGDDIDDLFALYLCLYHPRLELLAVTTAHGKVTEKARLVRKALRMVGRTDIPIGAGVAMSQERLARGDSPEKAFHSHIDYVTAEDPEAAMQFSSADSVLREALGSATRPVTLISIGALSNIASALQFEPELKAKIEKIAIMGGETQRVMNEYNIWCDPEAADRVLSDGIPVFMGTFVQTERLRMTMDQVEQEFRGDAHPSHTALRECNRLWDMYRGWKHGPILYDLVPIFYTADPACVVTRKSFVRVELNGTYTRGQTVRVRGEGEPHITESIDLNPDHLVGEFLSILRNPPKA